MRRNGISLEALPSAIRRPSLRDLQGSGDASLPLPGFSAAENLGQLALPEGVAHPHRPYRPRDTPSRLTRSRFSGSGARPSQRATFKCGGKVRWANVSPRSGHGRCARSALDRRRRSDLTGGEVALLPRNQRRCAIAATCQRASGGPVIMADRASRYSSGSVCMPRAVADSAPL